MNRNFAALAACALAACAPPKYAWAPGDPPLRYDAGGDEELAALFEAGCAKWAAVGLTCEAGTGDGAVRVRLGDVGSPTREGLAETWCGITWWSREFTVTLAPFTMERLEAGSAYYDPDRAVAVTAHEIGHLLGIWGHVDARLALMTATTTAYHVTPTDIAALPWAP